MQDRINLTGFCGDISPQLRVKLWGSCVKHHHSPLHIDPQEDIGEKEERDEERDDL